MFLCTCARFPVFLHLGFKFGVSQVIKVSYLLAIGKYVVVDGVSFFFPFLFVGQIFICGDHYSLYQY
jgi:hypothetical protein